MSKVEMLHDFYEQCKELNFDETNELIRNSKSNEEREFVRVVTNCILQQRQKKVVLEKRF